jgi:UTP--glucose-1-phosphate uridylyltransferase
MGDVKDAIILAGGLGTRMLPASLFAPKETMPLIDTPILNHLVWEAAKAGVKRVHLVLSKRKREFLDGFFKGTPIHGDEIRADLPRDSLSLGTVGIEVIPHVQNEAGGVADAISVAIDQVDGPFLVLLGDMLMMRDHFGPDRSGPEYASEASKMLVSVFEESGLPCVGVCSVDESEVSNYGVVEISEGSVISIEEKPSQSEAMSNYVLCGRYLFPENTSSILEDFPLIEFGEMQSIFLLNHLINNGGLNAVKFDEMEIYDSGDPVSWLKSQIDHGLRREDISGELLEWLSSRISRI